MDSDSRKAQRNSFAHHRAELLFSRHAAHQGEPLDWSATVHEGTEPTAEPTAKQRVRAGLLGFVSAGARAPNLRPA